MLQQLRERDIRRTSAMMSLELGLTHVNVSEGENVTGIYMRSAHLASGKFVIVGNRSSRSCPGSHRWSGSGGRRFRERLAVKVSIGIGTMRGIEG